MIADKIIKDIIACDEINIYAGIKISYSVVI